MNAKLDALLANYEKMEEKLVKSKDKLVTTLENNNLARTYHANSDMSREELRLAKTRVITKTIETEF